MRRDERVEFEQVFRSAYPSILRTAFLVLHDRGRAEEVTQEAFLRLYERWRKAIRYDHPVAWVRTVAVRDAIRRAERERRQTVMELVDNRGVDDRVPDLDLLDAVAALRPRAPARPPGPPAAVALYYLEDRPIDEIAVLMEVSSSTVKQHLFQARNKLGVSLLEGVSGDGE
jgi:RNA polymerase sigma factor (sigma-70 family)